MLPTFRSLWRVGLVVIRGSLDAIEENHFQALQALV